MKLDRNFFIRDAETVAKELLGKVLVINKNNIEMKAMITEAEAYIGPEDKASHAYNGRRTDRTETMFMDPGTVYVYLTYGMYNMLNIVTGEKEFPAAVLIRGAKPISDLNIFSKNRYGENFENLTTSKKKNLMNGPGKLTAAFGIDRSFDKKTVLSNEMYIEDYGLNDFKIENSKRIGIDYSEEWKDKLLRFYIDVGTSL